MMIPKIENGYKIVGFMPGEIAKEETRRLRTVETIGKAIGFFAACASAYAIIYVTFFIENAMGW